MITNKVAMIFNTRITSDERRKSTEQVLPALLQPKNFDLWWFDGSPEPPKDLMHHAYQAYADVTGAGGDYAVVFALTTLLRHPNNYTHIGICEDDILLDPDWFDRCMNLFTLSLLDDFNVGAVSARSYEDRCFIQCNNFAVMHNLGWGHVIFTREAAELTLDNYRTGWTTENRKTFAALSGRDIGPFWCWKAAEQWICSDWTNDAMLASHGIASLALTPSLCQMINQNPPLERQGLRLVTREVSMLRDDRVYAQYVQSLSLIRSNHVVLDTRPKHCRLDNGNIIYFAHQMKALGAYWRGNWQMEYSFGFGPFARKAAMPPVSAHHPQGLTDAELELRALGPVEFLIGGGRQGGKCLIRDSQSGYEIEPNLQAHQSPQDPLFMSILIPASASQRKLTVTNITPGVIIFGIKTTDAQLTHNYKFDVTCLPRGLVPPLVKAKETV